MRLPQRSAVWARALIGVGSVVLGMSQSVGAGGLTLATQMNAEASLGCSVATLHGTYSFATESLSTSHPGAGPFAYAGFVTYDGNGHESEVYTISINGLCLVASQKRPRIPSPRIAGSLRWIQDKVASAPNTTMGT
jgi:hypothetical protein